MTRDTQDTPDFVDGFGGGTPTFGDEKRRETRRRYLRLAGFTGLGLLALAVVIGLLASGDDESAVAVLPEDTPLIRAPETPYKVAPDTPGGMEVPHRDKFVYERLERIAKTPGAERLLPPPEQPLTPPQASEELPVPEDGDRTAPGLPALEPRVVPVDPAAPVAPPAGETPPQDQPVLATAAMPFRPAPPKPTRTATPAAVARPAPAAPPPAAAPSAPSASPGGGYLIQLIAVSSREQAATAWDQLRRQNPGTLGNLTSSISSVQLPGGRMLYRVRAGSFPTVEAAQSACTQLIARGVDCVLVRPSG